MDRTEVKNLNREIKLVCVVLNWNGADMTIECLQSLLACGLTEEAVLVVDNASTDGSPEKIRGRFPAVRVIENSENLGWSGGNNIGIEAALADGADCVFLLNNDTVLDPRAVEVLLEAAVSDPGAGMFSPKVLNYYRKDEFDFAGGRINWRDGRTYHRGKGEKDRGQYDRPEEMETLYGCALMVRREVIERIGLIDPGYFAYYEDTDWCVRARKAGFRLLYIPGSRVWHKISATNRVQECAPMPAYYLSRNRLIFLGRNRGTSPAFHLLNLFQFIRLSSSSLFWLATGRKKRASSVLWALLGLVDYYLGRKGKKEIGEGP